MSLADTYFIEMCKDIFENGTSTEGQKVRPHWPDGAAAYTKKIFGQAHMYDGRKEFPAMTLRKTAIKSATDEVLWIYQKKSNRIADLNSSVWDEWADEAGTIGKAYGFQIGETHLYKGVNDEGLKTAFPKWERTEGKDFIDYDYKNPVCGFPQHIRLYTDGENKGLAEMDQMNKVIYDLINAPFSRRIMTTTWNVSELKDMNLEPCAYSMTYNVTEENGELVLNAVLNQRSQDMLAANNWNIVQYYVLLMMVAQTCGMKPGRLLHVIADCHIYDRHVPMIEELISRTPLPAPKVTLNPEVKDFYDFTRNDVIIENYEVAGDQIKNIPIAI
jgi:thymidylate synthase